MSVKELIRACAEANDGAAWEEFVARFQRPISLSIARTASNGERTQRCLSMIYFKRSIASSGQISAACCRNLPSNILTRQCWDTLRQLLSTSLTITSNHSILRSMAQERPISCPKTSSRQPMVVVSGSPEAMDRVVFLKEVDAQLQDCAAGSNQERDCLIFWFYYLQGMSAKAIAALATIKLTAKGVEAVIFRLTRCVREHLGNSGTADSAEA